MSEPRDYSDLEKRLEDEREELKDCSRIFGEPSALDPITAQRIANTMFAAQEAIAELTKRCEESAPRWQLMEKRPPDMDCFLAAVEVHNRRTGKSHWDIHLVTLDDESGEINEDTGWVLEDYTWFAPPPSPPTGIGDANFAFPSQRQLPSHPLPDDPANGDEDAPGDAV